MTVVVEVSAMVVTEVLEVDEEVETVVEVDTGNSDDVVVVGPSVGANTMSKKPPMTAPVSPKSEHELPSSVHAITRPPGPSDVETRTAASPATIDGLRAIALGALPASDAAAAPKGVQARPAGLHWITSPVPSVISTSKTGSPRKTRSVA